MERPLLEPPEHFPSGPAKRLHHHPSRESNYGYDNGSDASRGLNSSVTGLRPDSRMPPKYAR